MGSKGQRTREHLLGTAQKLILQRGYAGTSIDDIIGEAGITKGGFSTILMVRTTSPST